MIREHAFNTRWWGAPVGYVDDPAFFHLPLKQRRDLLSPYAWAESALSPFDSAPHDRAMAAAGFFQFDTQITFRIGLRRVPESSSLEDLAVQFADEQPFTLDPGSLAPFANERFLRIPGADQLRVNQRYALWGGDLLASSPETCLAVLHAGRVQGWFLSQRCEKGGVHLALATNAKDASISGMYVYQKALLAYASRGYTLGWASFSAANVAVHNIYAGLGARFLEPRGNWLWLPE